MPVIKKYSYTFRGNEQDFFLRLFVDTENNPDILSNGSLWDDESMPARSWRGKVNMNSRTFAIRRITSPGAHRRKMSDFTIKGRLKEGPEMRLEIEFSIALLTVIFQLIYSAFSALIFYGILQSKMGLIVGVCVFFLLILLNVLDFNKSFNRIHDYLPLIDAATRKDHKVVQEKRYLK
jgi:hypothetical protein